MQMCDTRLVSIITPCYNSQHCLSEKIDSVLSQTYDNWEMIIVDDCSTDESARNNQSIHGKGFQDKIL